MQDEGLWADAQLANAQLSFLANNQAQRHAHHAGRRAKPLPPQGGQKNGFGHHTAQPAGDTPSAAAAGPPAAEVKRPFWEPPEAAGGGAGGGQQNGSGQAGRGGQRGPVRLLRITVPPVEGRCKCGECSLLQDAQRRMAVLRHVRAEWG